MTNPSTPRSTGSVRNGSGSEGGSPEVVTPGQKIRAILAEFDSDSDSGADAGKPHKPTSRPDFSRSISQKEHFPESSRDEANDNEDGDDDDDDLPARPRGKLAARMQGEAEENTLSSTHQEPTHEGNPFESHTRVTGPFSQSGDDTSEDEMPRAGGRRKGLMQKHRAFSNSDRSNSPLFVPMDSPSPTRDDSLVRGRGEAEQDSRDTGSKSRLQELVAQKRREREEAEKIEAQNKAERMEKLRNLSVDSGSEEGSDQEESGQKLTQQSRPARKASKKALMEMNRETQRMSRNMQLAHQTTTKKKFTMDSFLAAFNSKPTSNVQPSKTPTKPFMATVSSPHESDNDGAKVHSTPPTSPPPEAGTDKKVTQAPTETAHRAETDHTGAPRESTFEDLTARPITVRESHTVESDSKPAKRVTQKADALKARPVRVNLPREHVALNQRDDSDSDLEIVTSPSKTRRLALFENLPTKVAQSSSSLHKLRTLAQLTSPTRQREKSMTHGALEAILFKQARQQAAKERDEKIADLKARGVYIETAAERAGFDAEVEDLVEKARKEAEEIAKKERKSAKRNNEGPNAVDLDDEEEDGDYDGEGDDEIELSGSEDEDEGEGDEENHEDEDSNIDGTEVEEEGPETSGQHMDLVDDEATVNNSDQSDVELTQENGENGDNHVDVASSRRKKRSDLVIKDDDEEDADKTQPAAMQTPGRPQAPDLGKPETPMMGLTQAFAATLAESQDDTEQDSLEMLRKMPNAETNVSDLLVVNSQDAIPDTPGKDSGPQVDLFNTETQSVTVETPARSVSYSQVPEPSQDVGFVYSPFDQQKRFLEQPDSSVDTVLANGSDSPVTKKAGRRLHRGPAPVADVEQKSSANPNAFEVMQKATKKAEIPFDKTKSKALEVVDEAAEESEDEYAGLGGASDESAGEEDEFDKNMIDDESGEVADEKVLAALNAYVKNDFYIPMI